MIFSNIEKFYEVPQYLYTSEDSDVDKEHSVNCGWNS